MEKDLEVLPRLESDHLPVCFELSLQRTHSRNSDSTMGETPGAREKIRWNEFSAAEFEKDLEKIWPPMTEGELEQRPRARRLEIKVPEIESSTFSKEEAWNRIKVAIWDAARTAGMIKTPGKPSSTEKDPSWIDDEYREQRKLVFDSLKERIKLPADQQLAHKHLGEQQKLNV